MADVMKNMKVIPLKRFEECTECRLLESEDDAGPALTVLETIAVSASKPIAYAEVVDA
jgi:hypothetical protein